MIMVNSLAFGLISNPVFAREDRMITKTLILMIVKVRRRKMAEARRGRKIPGMAGRSSHL